MRVTHFGHACVLVEHQGARLLFDPGTASSGFEALTGLSAVLVTHSHDDHVDVARTAAVLDANPTAVLLAPADVVALLGRGDAVGAGATRSIGGLTVDTCGGAHAHVWRDIPELANLAFVVDGGAFVHPGDSFEVPLRRVDVLLLPISGPWTAVGRAADHLDAVRPRVAIPAHEAALSAGALAQAHGMLADFAPTGTTVLPLERGVATEV